MGLSISIAIFFFVIIVYRVIDNMFSVLFRMTGMTKEKAKFQVISLLTNSGFTTRESELVMEKPLRRRLARFIMLFGYIFSLTFIAAFVNVILNLPKAMQHDFWNISIMLIIIIILWAVVGRVTKVNQFFNNGIEKLGRRILYKKTTNILSVLDQYGNQTIVGINIGEVPEILKGKNLAEIEEDSSIPLRVVLIQREGQVANEGKDSLQIEEKDKIVVIGDLVSIHDLFVDSQVKSNEV